MGQIEIKADGHVDVQETVTWARVTLELTIPTECTYESFHGQPVVELTTVDLRRLVKAWNDKYKELADKHGFTPCGNELGDTKTLMEANT